MPALRYRVPMHQHPPRKDGESVTFPSNVASGDVVVTRLEGPNLVVGYPAAPENDALLYESEPGLFNLQTVAHPGEANPIVWRGLDWEILLEKL